MRRVVLTLLAAIVSVLALSAAPAAAVKDDCPPGIGLPGKDPLIPIYC
jgi:hypothetical protein